LFRNNGALYKCFYIGRLFALDGKWVSPVLEAGLFAVLRIPVEIPKEKTVVFHR